MNIIKKASHVGWVDSMRGIAALAVALFHGMLVLWVGVNALQALPASRIDRLSSYFSIPAHFGYIGVMLFFVLSGFVIHLPYAGNLRSMRFFPYLARRVSRIYPPYVAALVLSIIVGSNFHITNWGDHLDPQLIGKAFFMSQNYPHWGGRYAELAWLQPAGNLSLWSLPVEFELYLAYPIFLFAVRRVGLSRSILMVCIVSLAASVIDIVVAAQVGSRPNWGNYMPTFLHYWIVWCSGAWLAEKLSRDEIPAWNTGWVLLLVVTVGLVAANRQPFLPNDISDYILMTLFVSLLILIISQHNYRSPGARVTALSRIGNISYSLYLIHIPFFLSRSLLGPQIMAVNYQVITLSAF